MTLAVILERAVRFKPIEACLEFMGRISLESYLMNICLNALLLYMIPRFFDSRLFYGHFLEYTFVVIAGITGAWWINNTVTSDRGVVRKLLKS